MIRLWTKTGGLMYLCNVCCSNTHGFSNSCYIKGTHRTSSLLQLKHRLI